MLFRSPYNVQIHKYALGNGKSSYLTHMPYRLWMKYAAATYLRPEVMTNYSGNEIEPNFERFTWKRPVRCNECFRYIDDYEYYTCDNYSFRNQQETLYKYICCLSCYTRLLPTKDFKIPVARIIRKVLPLSERLVYWRNINTGEVFLTPPNKKSPLNPDAFDP